MKKTYLKPETTVVEYQLEGVIAMSGELGKNDEIKVDEGSESYSNKQGWDCSQWSEEE